MAIRYLFVNKSTYIYVLYSNIDNMVMMNTPKTSDAFGDSSF
jgi:hypothetical protein